MLGSRRHYHKTGDQLAQRRETYSQTVDERLVRGVVVRYSDRKAVERGRYKAVVPHKIDQLRQASLAEEGKSLSISRLWKHAAIDERRHDIVAGSVLFCQIPGLPGRQRRHSGIADLVQRSRFRNHAGGWFGSTLFSAPGRQAPGPTIPSCPARAAASGRSDRRGGESC
jgi:hypothetical protein